MAIDRLGVLLKRFHKRRSLSVPSVMMPMIDRAQVKVVDDIQQYPSCSVDDPKSLPHPRQGQRRHRWPTKAKTTSFDASPSVVRGHVPRKQNLGGSTTFDIGIASEKGKPSNRSPSKHSKTVNLPATETMQVSLVRGVRRDIVEIEGGHEPSNNQLIHRGKPDQIVRSYIVLIAFIVIQNLYTSRSTR
jgi:hypothetical protein